MRARRSVGRLQRQPKPGWRVVLLDECHAKLFPTRAPQWAKRGHYPEIPLLDRHGKCAVFGAVDLHTGRMFHHLAGFLSGAEQLKLLEQVAAAYPEERVLLVWDNGPTHRNQKVAAWLAEHPRVACFWLPPYSGAEANPLEHCWRWFREHVTHNHLFLTVEELTEAARRFFVEVASDAQAVLARLGQM
jgi:transposase